ncbi:formylglycine-generating enzyme family protein [Leucobacter luti]|nr:formylglycine-generating enzyme family protein [Leucobacter luti]MBL3700179.1 formylglycine-generating enzyme family protein [Leucobacter luti]
MRRLPGGVFHMGSDDFYPDERPAHPRTVAPFWIDTHAVTNAQFARFVAETGYVTVAERELDPARFPGADPADLVPGAMVFTPPPTPVDLGNWRNWWRWQPGASWQRPFGPASSIVDRLSHPVVHVAYEDASTYAAWAGKRLPTEAEHEYASRGGRDGAAFAWGDEPYPNGIAQANSWLGRFPHDNQGVGGTAPVGSYPPNGYGLSDMIGNVWEWTSDAYTPRHFPPSATPVEAGARPNLLAAPAPGTPPEPPRRVLKGGSFLCSPDYCLRFRPAARSPQAEDTGMSHIGFRCARDA